MASKKKLTSVQLDFETDAMLQAIAASYERSKVAQARFMIREKYYDLLQYKLVQPVAVDNLPGKENGQEAQ